jgi:transposase
MKTLPRRKFTEEFRQEAVRLVLEKGLGVTEVARRLQISDKSLTNWVYQKRREKAGKLPAAKRKALPVVSDLQMRVSQLEAENARLKMEKEILKKATAFFAKELP